MVVWGQGLPKLVFQSG